MVEKTEKKLNIYQKLLEVQKALSFVKHDAKGQGHRYASGEAILSIARPKMDELGLLLFQEIVESSHEHVIWNTSTGDKLQTFSHVKFRFTWIDVDSEKTIVHLFEADGFNSWDKAIGSAMTYGERYYFLKNFHVPTDDLDPNQREELAAKASPKKIEPKKIEPKKMSEDDLKRKEISTKMVGIFGNVEEAKKKMVSLFLVSGTSDLKNKALDNALRDVNIMWDEFKFKQKVGVSNETI